MKVGKLNIRKLEAADADLVLVVGYGDHHVRLDVGRLELKDGWLVKRTKIRAWKNLKYGIFANTKELFAKSWTH